ncbi:hypothetical protein [Nocardia donostiensis]|nr:hypothetical protein [Nocardia donostiensis]
MDLSGDVLSGRLDTCFAQLFLGGFQRDTAQSGDCLRGQHFFVCLDSSGE